MNIIAIQLKQVLRNRRFFLFTPRYWQLPACFTLACSPDGNTRQFNRYFQQTHL